MISWTLYKTIIFSRGRSSNTKITLRESPDTICCHIQISLHLHLNVQRADGSGTFSRPTFEAQNLHEIIRPAITDAAHIAMTPTVYTTYNNIPSKIEHIQNDHKQIGHTQWAPPLHPLVHLESFHIYAQCPFCQQT